MKLDNDIKKYLKSGPQTKLSDDMKTLATSLHKDGLDLIFEILAWLHKNLKENKDAEFKDKFFRKRTSQEIIKSKLVTGCTDWALAFIAIARAKNIPAVYVEAIRRRWLDIGNDNLIEGHVFTEVYIGNKWYIVDPQDGSIKYQYDKWVIFKKGLDSWDIGIKDFKDLEKQFLFFRKEYKKE